MFQSKFCTRMILTRSLLALFVASTTARAQSTPTAQDAAPNTSATDGALPDLSTETTPAALPIPNATPKAPDVQAQTPAEAQAAPNIPPPLRNEAPVTSSSLDEKTTMPLLFAPQDNKISLTSPQLKWDLAQGHHISFGGIAHDSNDIRMQGVRDKNGRWTLAFTWPQTLTKTGQLMVQGEQGDVLFRHQVTVSEIQSWASSTADAAADLRKATLGFRNFDAGKIAALAGNDPFQFCVVEERSKDERVKICSPFYRVDAEATPAVLAIVPQTVSATVIVDGRDVGPRGIVNYDGDKSITASVHFENGATIDFSSRPLRLNMLDVVWDGRKAADGSRGIIFTGQGPKPLGKVRNLEVPKTTWWAETSLGDEVIWQIRISENLPLLRVVGAWNIPFTFVVVFQDLPRDRDRVFIDKRTPKDTYSSAPRIHGIKKPSIKIMSKQKAAKADTTETFVWTFNAPRKGAFNRSRLLVKNNEDNTAWRAHYSFYRGYAFETSARLSGIVTQDGKAVPVGELAASWWPENLGFDSYHGDKQRWGFTARYFRPLESLNAKTDDATEPVEAIKFNSFNFDVKYNIQPGVWNRDQVYGAILSYQTIHLNDNTGTFAGLGGYWARSMPKFLDDFFNNAPFLRYPKYLDIELVYYPMAISSGTTPQAIYNLNFHSKVFWTHQLFGELGFGLKSFGFKTSGDSDINNIELNTLFGTIGVGAIF